MRASSGLFVSSLALVGTLGVVGCGDDGTSTGGAGGNSTTSVTTSSATSASHGATSTTASSTTNGTATATTSSASSGTGGGSPQGSFVYVESNDITANQNAIYAFSRGADGALTALTTPSFLTGGTGISNPNQVLGPDDSDQTLIASSDGKLVFAVNAGSDTIAVLARDAQGALTPITGSPFASGGKGPVSLGLAGTHLVVVNRGRDTGDIPNYTTFEVAASGALTAVANSTVALSPGSSPSQALTTPDGKLLFGTDFMGPVAVPPEAGPLRAFTIGATGLLSSVAGTPMAIPASTAVPPKPPLALGLALHPTQPILYTGFVTYSQLGVYNYAADGALTFDTAVSNSGAAICWLRVNAAGTKLYSVNSGSSTVSWYDLTNPAAPVEVDHLLLKNSASGMTFIDGMGMTQTITSSPFQFEISKDGKNLYVVSERVTTNPQDNTGNILHTLNVATDGSLTEPGTPIDFTVPLGTRVQGVLQIDD